MGGAFGVIIINVGIDCQEYRQSKENVFQDQVPFDIIHRVFSQMLSFAISLYFHSSYNPSLFSIEMINKLVMCKQCADYMYLSDQRSFDFSSVTHIRSSTNDYQRATTSQLFVGVCVTS